MQTLRTHLNQSRWIRVTGSMKIWAGRSCVIIATVHIRWVMRVSFRDDWAFWPPCVLPLSSHGQCACQDIVSITHADVLKREELRLLRCSLVTSQNHFIFKTTAPQRTRDRVEITQPNRSPGENYSFPRFFSKWCCRKSLCWADLGLQEVNCVSTSTTDADVVI